MATNISDPIIHYAFFIGQVFSTDPNYREEKMRAYLAKTAPKVPVSDAVLQSMCKPCPALPIATAAQHPELSANQQKLVN